MQIIGAYDCECNTDYILVGKSGEAVSAYIDAVDKEDKRKILQLIKTKIGK